MKSRGVELQICVSVKAMLRIEIKFCVKLNFGLVDESSFVR